MNLDDDSGGGDESGGGDDNGSGDGIMTVILVCGVDCEISYGSEIEGGDGKNSNVDNR